MDKPPRGHSDADGSSWMDDMFVATKTRNLHVRGGSRHDWIAAVTHRVLPRLFSSPTPRLISAQKSPLEERRSFLLRYVEHLEAGH